MPKAKHLILFKLTGRMTRSAPSSNTAKAGLREYLGKYMDETGKPLDDKKDKVPPHIRNRVAARAAARDASADPADHLGQDQELQEPTESGATPPKEPARRWVRRDMPLGKLTASGFVFDEARRTGLLKNESTKSPGGHMPRRQAHWIRQMTSAWLAELGKSKYNSRTSNGARFAVSLHPEGLTEILGAGVNPDEALMEILDLTLEKYKRRHGWENEKISFLAGLHHDRNHLHLHAILFPCTESGKALRTSNYRGKDREQDLYELSDLANEAARDWWREKMPLAYQPIAHLMPEYDPAVINPGPGEVARLTARAGAAVEVARESGNAAMTPVKDQGAQKMLEALRDRFPGPARAIDGLMEILATAGEQPLATEQVVEALSLMAITETEARFTTPTTVPGQNLGPIRTWVGNRIRQIRETAVKIGLKSPSPEKRAEAVTTLEAELVKRRDTMTKRNNTMIEGMAKFRLWTKKLENPPEPVAPLLTSDEANQHAGDAAAYLTTKWEKVDANIVSTRKLLHQAWSEAWGQPVSENVPSQTPNWGGSSPDDEQNRQVARVVLRRAARLAAEAARNLTRTQSARWLELREAALVTIAAWKRGHELRLIAAAGQWQEIAAQLKRDPAQPDAPAQPSLIPVEATDKIGGQGERIEPQLPDHLNPTFITHLAPAEIYPASASYTRAPEGRTMAGIPLDPNDKTTAGILDALEETRKRLAKAATDDSIAKPDIRPEEETQPELPGAEPPKPRTPRRRRTI